jgi:phenylacetate-CoA ligase
MRFNFHTVSSLPSLLSHYKAGRQAIMAFQTKRLRLLVKHAYRNVPYYRALFDRERIRPEDIRSMSDLSAIPVTSKKDLQALPPAEVVARGIDPKRLIERNTSGSSGEPFTIRRTWIEERVLGILRLRAMHDFGLRPTDRQAKVLLVRASHPRDHQQPVRLLQSLGWYNTLRVDCRQSPDEILRSLGRFQPDVVTGFAGTLWRTVQSLDGYGGRPIRPRFLVTGGEVLTANMRDEISAGFAAPVFDLYGSHEFNLLASQCKESGEYHVCDDGLILEVLKGDRPAKTGERGEVVGTNLQSYAMPFIRYRLGDIATRGSETCACGRPFSTLREIRGRMIDYFPLPSGRLLHPYEIVVPMKKMAPWIRQYQLIQERRDFISLRIVPFMPPSSPEASGLQAGLTALLEPGVDLQVVIVSEIPLDAGGKFRVSRSLVASGYDALADHEVVSL